MEAERHAGQTAVALQAFPAAPSTPSSRSPALAPRQLAVQAAPQRVVFLDVDGVLHSLYGEDVFRESCCGLLERILRRTGAALVLSSTWREKAEKVALLNGMLQKRGLLPIHDCTKVLDRDREEEICEWLDRHPEVTSWIAIDDMDLQGRGSPQARRMRGHFVRTSQSVGLTPQDAELCISLLLQGASPASVPGGPCVAFSPSATRRAASPAPASMARSRSQPAAVARAAAAAAFPLTARASTPLASARAASPVARHVPRPPGATPVSRFVASPRQVGQEQPGLVRHAQSFNLGSACSTPSKAGSEQTSPTGAGGHQEWPRMVQHSQSFSLGSARNQSPRRAGGLDRAVVAAGDGAARQEPPRATVLQGPLLKGSVALTPKRASRELTARSDGDAHQELPRAAVPQGPLLKGSGALAPNGASTERAFRVDGDVRQELPPRPPQASLAESAKVLPTWAAGSERQLPTAAGEGGQEPLWLPGVAARSASLAAFPVAAAHPPASPAPAPGRALASTPCAQARALAPSAPSSVLAAVAPRRRAIAPDLSLTVSALQGEWAARPSAKTQAEPDFVATICEGGRTLYQGVHMGGDGDLIERWQDGGGSIARADGWSVDMSRSSSQLLVWTRPGEPDMEWRRLPESPAASPSSCPASRGGRPGEAQKPGEQEGVQRVRVFLECVYAAGLELGDLALEERSLVADVGIEPWLVGRQAQPQLFARLVPDESLRHCVSRVHFEMAWERRTLVVRKRSANDLLLDGAPLGAAPVPVSDGALLSLRSGPPCEPFLGLRVRLAEAAGVGVGQARPLGSLAAVGAPPAPPASALAQASPCPEGAPQLAATAAPQPAARLVCRWAKGDKVSLGVSLASAGDWIPLPAHSVLAVGRDHQGELFRRWLGKDSPSLRMISRSHFEIAPVAGQPGHFEVVNLSSNPVLLGERQLDKFSRGTAAAPTDITFVKRSSEAAVMEPFLRLGLELVAHGSLVAEPAPAPPLVQGLAACCASPAGRREAGAGAPEFWIELSGTAVKRGLPAELLRLSVPPVGGLSVGRAHQKELLCAALEEGALQWISREHFRIEHVDGTCCLVPLTCNPMWLACGGELRDASRGQPALPLVGGDAILLFTGAMDGTPDGPGSSGSLRWSCVTIPASAGGGLPKSSVGPSGSHTREVPSRWQD